MRFSWGPSCATARLLKACGGKYRGVREKHIPRCLQHPPRSFLATRKLPFVCYSQFSSNQRPHKAPALLHPQSSITRRSARAHGTMSSWSSWNLDVARSGQDQQNWHLYRAEISGEAYTGNYHQIQYPRLRYPKYVASLLRDSNRFADDDTCSCVCANNNKPFR